jgi:hypothetical protein
MMQTRKVCAAAVGDTAPLELRLIFRTNSNRIATALCGQYSHDANGENLAFSTAPNDMNIHPTNGADGSHRARTKRDQGNASS